MGCENMDGSRVMGRGREEKEYSCLQWVDIVGTRVVINGLRHLCIKRGKSGWKHPSIEYDMEGMQGIKIRKKRFYGRE